MQEECIIILSSAIGYVHLQAGISLAIPQRPLIINNNP